MPMSTADQNYIAALATAINNYAVAMEAFTAGAATTAANNLGSAITAAQTAWGKAVQLEGE